MMQKIPVAVRSRKGETPGERLRRLRREKGLTQAELARAIGTSQPTVAHYERRGDVPGPHVLLKLSEVLGAPPDEILGIKRARVRRKGEESPENLRLWRKLKRVETLPPSEQKHVVQLVEALLDRHALRQRKVS